jgi:hypothetical protein
MTQHRPPIFNGNSHGLAHRRGHQVNLSGRNETLLCSLLMSAGNVAAQPHFLLAHSLTAFVFPFNSLFSLGSRPSTPWAIKFRRRHRAFRRADLSPPTPPSMPSNPPKPSPPSTLLTTALAASRLPREYAAIVD